MKKLNILSFLFCCLFATMTQAQITVLDFESAAKSTTFQYFGSSLEPQLTGVIDNPDKTGINTSAKVGEFKKPAASQPWAGAFSSPNPTTQVDVTTGGMICVKVWSDHVGNLALKLEGGSNGAPNWVTKVPITETNKWVELCFDPSQNSIEAPNKPAVGASYKTVVLFFDFDVVLTEEKKWYFDDLVVKTGSSGPKKVTFNVDMKKYTTPFGKVYVSGTFNNWSGDANQLTDADGDKVYSAELTIPQGGYEYKFTIDNWAKQEEFNGLEVCTVTDPSGKFHNRSVTVTTDKALPTVCWNSCYQCGDGVKITVNLGMGTNTPSPDGIYLVGGGNFDAPGGKYRMQDPDKDGVYSISVERQKGFQSFFTFANGNCPDYSCKENIAGQSCANPANFNDRKLPPVTKDTILNTCFGQCTTTTACGVAPKPGKITFKVDMKNVKDAFTKVFVSGTFNNWSGNGNELLDPDKDKIYEAVLDKIPAGVHEFKFQLDEWAKQEQFKGGESCTITDPSGQFVNRKITVDGDATLEAVCYNACVTCAKVGINDVFVRDLISVQPTIADDMVKVLFSENFATFTKQISIISLDGKITTQVEVPANATAQDLNVSNLPNGMYIIMARAGVNMQTNKIVVKH
jgi:Glycogen recognition site of AMP-activated protein kinase/Secretion system C-terminal sorting domain